MVGPRKVAMTRFISHVNYFGLDSIGRDSDWANPSPEDHMVQRTRAKLLALKIDSSGAISRMKNPVQTSFRRGIS